jgi:hypothetical protein
MAKTSTTLSKGDNLPPRGRAKKTLILEAIRDASLMDTTPDSTQEQVEKAFFTHIAKQAASPASENFGMCLKLLADKGWSSIKPTMEHVEFSFNESAKPHEQAAQVMKAAASGQIPPDVAQSFITSIASMLKITEVTELEDRIKALEDNDSEQA